MLKIVKLKRNELTKLKPLLCLGEDSFLLSNKSIDKQARLKYLLSELKKDDEILVAREGRNILGYASLKKLNWDSRHFGLKMAALKLKSLTKNYNKDKKIADLLAKNALMLAENKKIKHLSVKINPLQVADIHALEENGFYFVACLVNYILALNYVNFSHMVLSVVDIGSFERKDLKRLKEIALDSFKAGGIWLDRFHADSNLDKKKSDELYVKWLTNCCLGREADMVLVARKSGKPTGFISAKYDKDTDLYLAKKVARIPLNAVDKKFREHGIYHALVYELLSILQTKGMEYAIITTQLTTRAVARVWMALGAKIESSKLVFHKFMDL